MSRIHYGVAAGLLACLLPLAPARALPNDNARFALHLTPKTTKNACSYGQAACSQLVTRGGLYPGNIYYAYLLVVDGDAAAGVGGLDVGVTYNGAPGAGVDVFTWTLCGTLELSASGWPASGGGDLITWDSATKCQRTEPGGAGTGVTAVAGYFYMAAYSDDVMSLTIDPKPGRQSAVVADCAANAFTLEGHGVHFDQSHLGSARFSAGAAADGYSPCNAPYVACVVSGPAGVGGASLTTYSAAGNTSLTTYSWSVTGSGLIAGPLNGPTVQVQAGASGNFTVSCLVGDGLNSYSCSKRVSIVPVSPCTLTGPASLHTGEVGGYSVAAVSGAGYNWQVSGNGQFSGPTNGPTVSVVAGAAGSLTVTCDVTSPSVAQHCSRTTSVASGCLILGLANVAAHTAGLNYSLASPPAGASFAWSITGQGVIPGATNGSSVQVSSLNPGQFTLTLIQSLGGSADTCHITTTVVNALSPRPLIMLHLGPRTTKNACTAPPACAQVRTNGGLYPNVYYAYLLASVIGTNAGIGGVQCGVGYNSAATVGVDVFSWTLCATLEFASGNWPASGGGNRILWDAATRCQTTEPGGAGTGVVATAGYFYMAAYSPDLLRVTPRPSDNRAALLDCTGGELTVAENPPQPSPFGTANFTVGGTAPGYAPCGAAVPVRITTWGGIKALYGGAGAGGRRLQP